MGMDLVTVGWTHDNDNECDSDTALEIIKNMEFSEETAIRLLDTAGFFPDGEDEDNTTTVRETLAEGVRTYQSIVRADEFFRMETSFSIGDTDRTLYVVGGGSWGDDPFDGFSALCLLLTCAELNKELANALGFIGYGIVLPGEGPGNG